MIVSAEATTTLLASLAGAISYWSLKSKVQSKLTSRMKLFDSIAEGTIMYTVGLFGSGSGPYIALGSLPVIVEFLVRRKKKYLAKLVMYYAIVWSTLLVLTNFDMKVVS